MKVKRIVTSVILLALLFTVSACTSSENGEAPIEQTETALPSEPVQQTVSDVPSETETLPKGEVEYVMVPAPSLENNMIEEKTQQGVAVYLPPSYNTSDKEFPVLYFLPGYGDDYKWFMNMFSSSMDNLLAKEDIDEMIVVTINGIGVLEGTFYYNSPVTGNWEDFVTKDVVQYIDDNYRTIKSADARGLAGHSMGGFGVINAAMHTNNIFNYIYSMSPGLFDENGLSKSLMSFNNVDRFIAKYIDADDETTKTEYLKYIKTLSWEQNFSFAYGSAFSPDVNVKAPYIKLPQKDSDGKFLQDDTWTLYDAGYGGIINKLDTYQDNLLSLKGLMIEYGTNDDFPWIPQGCKYFSEQLNERNIPHEMVSFNGDHMSLIGKRINDEVIPYFSGMFAKDAQ